MFYCKKLFDLQHIRPGIHRTVTGDYDTAACIAQWGDEMHECPASLALTKLYDVMNTSLATDTVTCLFRYALLQLDATWYSFHVPRNTNWDQLHYVSYWVPTSTMIQVTRDVLTKVGYNLTTYHIEVG